VRETVLSRAQRITAVYVENWRNFQRIETKLAARTFLVGPNASGKSNFLDIFRFLGDIASVGGGFQRAVDKRGGVTPLRCLAARRHPAIVIKVNIGREQSPEDWTYELAFTQDNQRIPLIFREAVWKGGEQILDRPQPEDTADPQRRRQTFLEQISLNKDFRQVADFFRSIAYLHIVPQLVREPDRSVGRQNDPFGGDFLERIARVPERTRASRLKRIVAALKVAVPQLDSLELHRAANGTPHLRGKYVHWRPQGAWQSEDQFSDGTLRLMGLLWAALDGSGPLLLEEPELSLHPEVVRYVPQLLARVQRRSGRQFIESSHSSDLLRDSGIGLDELLLLTPSTEGTTVTVASSLSDAKELLEGGMSPDELVLPRTRPPNASQLTLFGAD
jgi:predicted ATPase